MFINKNFWTISKFLYLFLFFTLLLVGIFAYNYLIVPCFVLFAWNLIQFVCYIQAEKINKFINSANQYVIFNKNKHVYKHNFINNLNLFLTKVDLKSFRKNQLEIIDSNDKNIQVYCLYKKVWSLRWLYICILKEDEKLNLENYNKLLKHELKTPINNVISAANLLKINDKDNSKESTVLKIILEQLEKLNLTYQTIENIENLSINNFIESKQSINLTKYLLESIRIWKKDCNQINFTTTSKNISVHLNVVNLNIIFSNLYKNAFKYKKDVLKLRISVKKINKKVHVSFKDFGIGIEKDQLNKIWEKNYQVNSASIGDGIGLFLIKEICAKNHIKIKVKSKPKFWTEFKLIFNNFN